MIGKAGSGGRKTKNPADGQLLKRARRAAKNDDSPPPSVAANARKAFGKKKAS